MKMRYALLAAALSLLLAGCQAEEPVETVSVPLGTAPPMKESAPSEAPSPTQDPLEELLARQPIDDDHDAFLVDTGGRLGTLLVTAELEERGPEGTFIDSTYFTAPRGTPDGSLAMAKEHGWDKIAPCEIIDADGDMDLPVRGGNVLKYFRVGNGFAQYDGAIAIMLFKPHDLPQYDGMTKALSIPFGSRSGKAILHSGGKKETPYYPGDGGEQFKLAVADATKAVNESKPWVYINVLADICVDDSCRDAKPLGNIGVLASIDPVAIDRAACDMTFGQGTEAEAAAWEKLHGVDTVLNAAEKIGAGKQRYRIVEIR